jgi:hypothetical protein
VSSWQILTLDEANEKFVNSNQPTDFEQSGVELTDYSTLCHEPRLTTCRKVAGEFFATRKLAGNGVRGDERASDSTKRQFPEADFWPGTVSECPGTQAEAGIAIAISLHR